MSEKENKNIKTKINKKVKPLILLVEDDEFLLNMYKTKIVLEKYDVIVANNGEKAYKQIVEKKPDLILLDIVLPKMTGFEVLAKIKNEDDQIRNIPVILLTNLGQREDIKRGLELGAKEYLIKAHFLPSEVMEKIKKVLDKK